MLSAWYKPMICVAALAAGVAVPAAAEEPDLDERLRRLEELVARQAAVIEQQQRAIQRLATEAGPAAAGAAQSRPSVGRPPSAEPPGQPTPARVPPKPRQRPEIAVEELVERGGVLTPPGTLVLEPSLEYVHDSSNRVIIEGLSVLPALLVGNIDVREVKRDSLFAALTGRLGLTNRFEVDVKVPYVYRSDETTARALAVEDVAASVTDVSGHGIGDVEAGLHYQLTEGNHGWPYFIGNLRAKAPTGRDPFEVPLNEQGLALDLPTGTGFWSVEPSLSFLLPSDPVVWFGNVKYQWNIERDIGGDFGTIDPGDAVGASVGLGFAVNDRTSFSVGWEQQYVFETEQDGLDIEGSSLSVGSFLLGLSYRLTDSTSISLSFQGGMTGDATDERIMMRLPIRLDL